MELNINEVVETQNEVSSQNDVVCEELDLIEAAEITVGHAFHAFRF